MNWLSVMKGMFEGIKDETRMCCPADPPANNPAGKDINDDKQSRAKLRHR